MPEQETLFAGDIIAMAGLWWPFSPHSYVAVDQTGKTYYAYMHQQF